MIVHILMSLWLGFVATLIALTDWIFGAISDCTAWLLRHLVFHWFKTTPTNISEEKE